MPKEFAIGPINLTIYAHVPIEFSHDTITPDFTGLHFTHRHQCSSVLLFYRICPHLWIVLLLLY